MKQYQQKTQTYHVWSRKANKVLKYTPFDHKYMTYLPNLIRLVMLVNMTFLTIFLNFLPPSLALLFLMCINRGKLGNN